MDVLRYTAVLRYIYLCDDQYIETKLNMEYIYEPVKSFDKWTCFFDEEQENLHLFYNTKPGYPQFEKIIFINYSWELHFEGKLRKADFNWTDLPDKTKSISDLKLVMNTFQTFKMWQCLDYNKHNENVESEKEIVYGTKTGEPAAFLEVEQPQFHYKAIQSAQCSIVLQIMTFVLPRALVTLIKQSEYYMRYFLKSSTNFYSMNDLECAR